MDNNSLTAADFEGIKPKPNSFEFSNLVVVSFVALAKSKGMPKTEVIRKLQRRENPDVDVVDNERERGKIDESLDDEPSDLPNPSSFRNIPKRIRSPIRENVELRPRIVPSILIPIGKEPKIEALMMLEKQECFSVVDAEFKKTLTATPKKRYRSDIGCSNNGENTRPMQNPEVGEDCGPVLHPDLSIRSSKNPERVVVADEERDKSINDEPSFPNPSSFTDIPKRKRSPPREIDQPNHAIFSSLLFPISKEGKTEQLMMIERDQECFGVDVKGKKTQRACRRKCIRSDIGCSNNGGTKARPMKKLKKEDCGPLPPPDLPQNFRDKIEALKGNELKLVIQKRLTISDIDEYKYRMSIPTGEIRNEFLRREEKGIFELPRNEKDKIKGIEVELIEPSCERVTRLSLRRWWMDKGNGNTNPIYNLVNKNWYSKVVVDNGLLMRPAVQLWAFRVEGKLQFALVKVDDGAAAAGGDDPLMERVD